MKTSMVQVFVNGEPIEVPANQSVSFLLKCLNVTSDRVAIELNKSIVRKRDWADVQVFEGSHIEIVEFVGGG